MIVRTLLLTASLSLCHGFRGPVVSVRPVRRHARPSIALSAVKTSEKDPQVSPNSAKVVTDNVDIARDWTYEGFDSKKYGDMTVDIIAPQGKKTDGAVFFMHGFSQYPIAYRETLEKTAEECNVAVIAVETGLTDKIARDQTLAKGDDRGDKRQYALQRAVSQDTAQCIRMALAGDKCFSKYFGKRVPLGLAGHSMGGGLCFFVATQFKDIDHIFVMAPVAGVEEFNPSEALKDGRVVDSSMLLAGSWDLIAKDTKVKAMSALSNQERKNSSLYGLIARGLHTGFQDEIVLFDLPFGSILGLVLFAFFGFVEYVVLKIVRLFRASTDQLEDTRELMSYFFGQMVDGKPVRLEDVKNVGPKFSRPS